MDALGAGHRGTSVLCTKQRDVLVVGTLSSGVVSIPDAQVPGVSVSSKFRHESVTYINRKSIEHKTLRILKSEFIRFQVAYCVRVLQVLCCSCLRS